eukprot:4989247-Amphidinium_carterae.1
MFTGGQDLDLDLRCRDLYLSEAENRVNTGRLWPQMPAVQARQAVKGQRNSDGEIVARPNECA